MNWTLKTTAGTELAKVLNFTPALDRAKVLTKLYGGGYLAQTMGEPALQPTVNILVESMAQLRAVNAAEAECALLRLSYAGSTYVGYIVAAPVWTPIVYGKVYTAPITFAVTEEVSA